MRAGLIQTSLKGETSWEPERIRDAMLADHIRLSEDAARDGVQVLCYQELFQQPYFCTVVDKKWFAAAESVPDGPTITAVRELARRLGIVIVAPVFEKDGDKFFNTAVVIDADGSFLGKYRKVHVPYVKDVGDEAYYFSKGDLGYPVFDTAFCKLGAYICYDRHFPEGWRALALKGAQYVVNPAATVEGLSRYIWHIEQTAAAVANCFFVGTINRVGVEAPWKNGRFYGQSYIVDPKANILAQAGDEEGFIAADLDLGMIDEVRERWRWFDYRAPDTYGDVVAQ